MGTQQDDTSIAGNAALVTASSSGLGKASAAALAARDANVVVNGRDPERLEAAVADLEAAGSGSIVGCVADLTDRAAVERLVETTTDAFGGLDHLVTSAGGPPSGAFLEMTDEDWYDAFDLLVMSAVRTVRAAAPALQAAEGGTIVTITSRSVKEAIPGIVLSNAVRMAVIGLGKTLSREFAPAVRVNSVLPGPHETDRSKELHQEAVDAGEYDTYEDAVADTAASIPLDRIGGPDELGEVVAFLSSEQSSFLTGVAIPVDGGAGSSNL